MPERRRMDIEGYRQILRLFFLQRAEQNIQKTIDRIGVQPLGIRQVRKTVESTVQNTVPIDQNNFFTHTKIILSARVTQ